MDPSDDDYYSEGVDSDEPDSEVEALLYSKIHYAEDVDSDTGNQCNEVATVPQNSPEKSEKKLNLPTCSNDEEFVILDEIYSDYQPSTSDSDPDIDLDDDLVVVSSDDDVMMFGDSDPDITINADGVPDTRTGLEHEDLWHIDAEDKYRNIQGFRYHNMPNFHCKSCGKMGHLSKNCPQPKEKVCYLCSLPGHRGSLCPSRMCTRCFSEGHVGYECNQPYVEHCYVCNLTGHPSRLCPDFWRRYHLTTKAGPIVTPMPRNTPQHGPFCFNCAGEGHYGHRCPFKRRGFFTTPFIVSYAVPRWDESVDEEESGPSRKKWKAKRRAYRTSTDNPQNRQVGRRKKKKASKGTQNGEASQTATAHKNCSLKQKKKKGASVKQKQKKKEKRLAAKALRKTEEKRAVGTNKNKNGNSRKKAPVIVHLQSAS